MIKSSLEDELNNKLVIKSREPVEEIGRIVTRIVEQRSALFFDDGSAVSAVFALAVPDDATEESVTKILKEAEALKDGAGDALPPLLLLFFRT